MIVASATFRNVQVEVDSLGFSVKMSIKQHPKVVICSNLKSCTSHVSYTLSQTVVHSILQHTEEAETGFV